LADKYRYTGILLQFFIGEMVLYSLFKSEKNSLMAFEKSALYKRGERLRGFVNSNEIH